MRTTDKKKFVKWMRNNAAVLKKEIDKWPEDFETEACAFLLEWAAEIIIKYAPAEIPPKKLRKRKDPTK